MAHKYSARRTAYNGVVYDSAREAAYARTLDSLKAARKDAERVVAWRRQIRFQIIHLGVYICKVVIDFEVVYADGRVEYHEVKGVETPVWKLKRKLLEAERVCVLKVIR